MVSVRRVAVAGADLLSRVCSLLLAKTGTIFFTHLILRVVEVSVFIYLFTSKKEHTRLSKSAPATATRLTMPRRKCPPNRVQAHTRRLFSP